MAGRFFWSSLSDRIGRKATYSTFFTLGALLVYRMGTYIPLPGINLEALTQAFQQQSSGILGMAISICGFIGILAGMIPAYTASRLDPVVAIRS